MTIDAHVVLAPGEKVHVIVRRLFDEDVRRHFVGEVLAVTGNRVRAEGYVFVYHDGRAEYERKPEKRVRVLSLATPLTVNVIPSNVDIDRITYRQGENGLVVTDGIDFSLCINEFGPRG